MRLTGDQQLNEAVALAKQGDATRSLRLLRKITTHDPNNVHAWMWMAYVAPTNDQKRAALRRALALKPDSRQIRQTLERLITPRHIQRAANDGVFIGYSRADEVFAVDLNESLRANGFTTWLDIAEIDPETTWHHSIARALRECGLMVMILSPAALQSDDLGVERDWFLQTGKIILPVLHQDCDYQSLNLICTPIDFRYEYGSGVQALIKTLTASQTHNRSFKARFKSNSLTDHQAIEFID